MPVDIFLKLDGITGESRDKTHGNEIDVLGWSWGMTLKMNRGGGGPAKAPEVEQLQITKFVDRASPALMTALTRATKIGTATMVCRKAGGVKPLEFFKITMTDALIVSIRPNGMGGDERFTEQVVLDFAKVSVSYQEQDDKGISKGGTVEFDFNLKSNV